MESFPINTEEEEEQIRTLRDVCLEAIYYHYSFGDLGAAKILNLPKNLLKELLPYFNPCQLDEFQPGLERIGVSTYSAWMRIYQELEGKDKKRTFATWQEIRVEVMRRMFAERLSRTSIDSGIWNFLNMRTFLSTAVKYVNHVTLSTDMAPAFDLTATEPLLASLEKTVESLKLEWMEDTSRDFAERLSFVVHRLLDHGVVKHVSVESPFCNILFWLFSERGNLYTPIMETDTSERLFTMDVEAVRFYDENGPPVKHYKTDKTIRSSLHRCKGSYPDCVSPCPAIKIQSLELTDCLLAHVQSVIKVLPTFDSLTTLTVEMYGEGSLPIWVIEDAATALASLSSRPERSLRRLRIQSLQCGHSLCHLLAAYRELKELEVMIRSDYHEPAIRHQELHGECLLKHLWVHLDMIPLSADFLLTALKACPHLLSLHVHRMRLPTGHSQKELLNTLAESNISLTSLSLQDLNLSDCLDEIIKLLSVCKLQELHLKDCRLLESAANKAESLRQLVDALKTLPSLRKLTLSHNRLAKHVHVLAQLFSGPAPSSLEYLHIGANFIQPADLLQFAEALSGHPPPRQLTLDLTTNPADRDADTWKAALDKLRPFCHLLTNKWESRNAMADYISDM